MFVVLTHAAEQIPLAELVVLDVSYNQLAGYVAQELFELPKISYIYLGGNQHLRVDNGTHIPRALAFSTSDYEYVAVLKDFSP